MAQRPEYGRVAGVHVPLDALGWGGTKENDAIFFDEKYECFMVEYYSEADFKKANGKQPPRRQQLGWGLPDGSFSSGAAGHRARWRAVGRSWAVPQRFQSWRDV